MSWVWLDEEIVIAIHQQLSNAHSTSQGIRDSGLLQSALTRARNTAACGVPGAADLAAAYAFGIARNHPFVDGNKQVAAVAMEVFLNLNNHTLNVSDAALVFQTQAVAAGELSEAELASWIYDHLKTRV